MTPACIMYNMQEFHYSVSFIYKAVTDVISEIMLSEIDLSPQCWQTSSSLQPAEYDSSVWTTSANNNDNFTSLTAVKDWFGSNDRQCFLNNYSSVVDIVAPYIIDCTFDKVSPLLSGNLDFSRLTILKNSTYIWKMYEIFKCCRFPI